MAEIDDLISQVGDDKLRGELARAAANLRANKKFGLVYERHLPETVLVPVDGKPSVGAQVVVRTEPTDTTRYVVESVNRTHATLTDGEATRKVRHRDLLVVKPFGEPVFPVLRPYGTPVLRGGDKPFHTVINGENFHALQLLLLGYESKVDCIYIDPPYNTGARDWKYNNDYVETDDSYRHSKWLSMMEKRLRLAKRLLNPDKSVLVVTIDEKEYLRTGMLLEELFPDCDVQMVSSLINPAGVARQGGFSRTDEYVFVVRVGSAKVQRVMLDREWVSGRGRTHRGNLRWDMLRRSSTNAERSHSPGCFYPIYIDPSGPKVHSIGAALPSGESAAPPVAGMVAVLPIRRNGTEGNWQWSPTTFESRLGQGRVRVTGNATSGFVISVLKEGEFAKIGRGEYTVTGYRVDGSVEVADIDTARVFATPGSQWRIGSHDSTQYGSRLLDAFLPDRKFPFPKSLYAVEDALRFFLADTPDALVLDFFSGSGTTAHAVARLNRQDGGRRRAILVTNNEVSDDERRALIAAGHSPGDSAWEDQGIFRYITVPRVTAALTGKRSDGTALPGDYKFTDEFPMADGFEENAAFFSLSYVDPDSIETGRRFEDVLPALWLAAGSVGDITQMKPTAEWFLDPVANFAVLLDEDRFASFSAELSTRDDITHVWLVTNSTSSFARMSSKLPDGVQTGMLYRDYLRNFRLNLGEVV